MKTKQQTFIEFHASGYEVLEIFPDNSGLESYELRPLFDRIHTKICDMANAGLNFDIVTKIRDGQAYVLAVDKTRREEIDMDSISLPTFKDLVADEIAKYLEIEQVKLTGNENPNFVLSRIITSLTSGDWKRYEGVTPDDIRSKHSM